MFNAHWFIFLKELRRFFSYGINSWIHILKTLLMETVFDIKTLNAHNLSVILNNVALFCTVQIGECIFIFSKFYNKLHRKQK